MISTRYWKGLSLMHTHTLKLFLRNILFLFLIKQVDQSVIPILLYLIVDPNYKRNTKAKYWFWWLFIHYKYLPIVELTSRDIVWHFKGIFPVFSGKIGKLLLMKWTIQTAAGFDSFTTPWSQRNTKFEARHFYCKFTVCQLLLQIASGRPTIRMDFDGKYSSLSSILICFLFITI